LGRDGDLKHDSMAFFEKTNSSVNEVPLREKPLIIPCHAMIFKYNLPDPAVINSLQKIADLF
jgi:hypothetical protein